MINTLLMLQLLTAQTPFVDWIGTEVVGNHLLPNVLAYYRMEEVGNPLDSAYLHHLTMVGSSPTNAGKLDLSKTIGGNSTYFWLPDDDAFDPGTNDFTIMCWVYITQPFNTAGQHRYNLVSKWFYDSTGTWTLGVIGTGNNVNGYFSFAVEHEDETTSETIYVDGGAAREQVALNTWYCLTARIIRANRIIKVDYRKATGTWQSVYGDINEGCGTPGCDKIPLMNSAAPLVINGARTMAGVMDPYTDVPSGTRIDELAFWQRALSDCERDQYFNNNLGQYLGNYNALPCQ